MVDGILLKGAGTIAAKFLDPPYTSTQRNQILHGDQG